MEPVRAEILSRFDSLEPGLAEQAKDLVASLSSQHLQEISAFTAHNINVDDLYSKIGAAQGAGAIGVDHFLSGMQAVARWKSAVADIVCPNAAVQAYCKDPNTMDMTAASALVLGAILQHEHHLQFGGGLNAVMVSCLVIRIGLRQLCGAGWTRETPQ